MEEVLLLDLPCTAPAGTRAAMASVSGKSTALLDRSTWARSNNEDSRQMDRWTREKF